MLKTTFLLPIYSEHYILMLYNITGEDFFAVTTKDLWEDGYYIIMRFRSASSNMRAKSGVYIMSIWLHHRLQVMRLRVMRANLRDMSLFILMMRKMRIRLAWPCRFELGRWAAAASGGKARDLAIFQDFGDIWRDGRWRARGADLMPYYYFRASLLYTHGD